MCHQSAFSAIIISQHLHLNISDCIVSYPIHPEPLSHWHTTAWGHLIFKRDHKSFTVRWHHCVSEFMTKKERQIIFSTKFHSDNCLISPSVSCVNSQSVCSSKRQIHCLSHKAHNKSLSSRSPLHARCPLLVSKTFLKQAPLALHFSETMP